MIRTDTQAQAELADTAARTVISHLESAWNAGNGAAFGEPFTDDAVFVDIRGARHYGGRAAITAGHQAIFDSIYRGSTVRYVLDSLQPLAAGVVAVHGDAVLECPTGPMAGTSRSSFTVVLAQRDGDWRALTFHNTLVQA
jgi:uncharacterized protein (TIGR02246 family)